MSRAVCSYDGSRLYRWGRYAVQAGLECSITNEDGRYKDLCGKLYSVKLYTNVTTSLLVLKAQLRHRTVVTVPKHSTLKLNRSFLSKDHTYSCISYNFT